MYSMLIPARIHRSSTQPIMAIEAIPTVIKAHVWARGLKNLWERMSDSTTRTPSAFIPKCKIYIIKIYHKDCSISLSFLTILADDVAIFPFPNPPLSGVRRGWVKKSIE
jgi:hypothetical protein